MALYGGDPLVVQSMRAFRAQLLTRESLQQAQMAQQWLDVEQALKNQLDALAFEVMNSNTALTAGRLARMQRFVQLIRQAQEEFAKYARYAGKLINEEQYRMANEGLKLAENAIKMVSVGSGLMGLYFDVIPARAVEALVGIAGNGQPLGELLKQRMVADANGHPLPGVYERLVKTLVNGAAQGWNPAKMARQMQNDLAGGLQKALEIARTEEIRVLREATRLQYEESGVVSGHMRVSAHDMRVCVGCLADEGTIYPVSDILPDHPNGRCTSIPVVKGAPLVEWEKGEAWFMAQSEEVQRQILGNKRFEQFAGDGFKFGDLVTRTWSSIWGEGVIPTPAKNLGGSNG